MIRRPPRSTLFPSPPLFRSDAGDVERAGERVRLLVGRLSGEVASQAAERVDVHAEPQRIRGPAGKTETTARRDVRRHRLEPQRDRKSTRLNSSHANISYAVF